MFNTCELLNRGVDLQGGLPKCEGQRVCLLHNTEGMARGPIAGAPLPSFYSPNCSLKSDMLVKRSFLHWAASPTYQLQHTMLQAHKYCSVWRFNSRSAAAAFNEPARNCLAFNPVLQLHLPHSLRCLSH